VTVTAHRVKIVETALAERVEALLERVRARDAGYTSLAEYLHDLLIAPVMQELEGVTRIAIVADGPLSNLPFQVLVDGRARPLLTRFEIRYAPSLAAYLRDAGSMRTPRSILAVGDPEVGGAGEATFRALVPGETLGQLPDAAREAQEVAKLYPVSRVLTGKAADETVFKEEIGRYAVVHVAAHALIDETQPLYSSIVFAAQNPANDGLLEARELQALDLHAQLFVLSACSTARGRRFRGEGVVGLAWALLSRGTPEVVVSQWNADSRATARLMVLFHRYLVRGQTAASALRQAQIDLRADVRYADPLYWAPFILFGSARGSSSGR
jgi:CHAT domain-containing protein